MFSVVEQMVVKHINGSELDGSETDGIEVNYAVDVSGISWIGVH